MFFYYRTLDFLIIKLFTKRYFSKLRLSINRITLHLNFIITLLMLNYNLELVKKQEKPNNEDYEKAQINW